MTSLKIKLYRYIQRAFLILIDNNIQLSTFTVVSVIEAERLLQGEFFFSCMTVGNRWPYSGKSAWGTA
jgi:hypothetical protein